MMLVENLVKQGVAVVVHDPAATEAARERLGSKVAYAESFEECARQADALAITTAWNEYKRLSPKHLKNNKVAVIDCWRMLPKGVFKDQAKYVTLGPVGLVPGRTVPLGQPGPGRYLLRETRR